MKTMAIRIGHRLRGKAQVGALVLALVCSAVLAQSMDDLPDPTRPSGWSEGGSGGAGHDGYVLQATRVSAHERVAVVNGQRVAVGDRIRGATVKDIQPFQVTLQRAGRDITLRLMPLLNKEKR